MFRFLALAFLVMTSAASFARGHGGPGHGGPGHGGPGWGGGPGHGGPGWGNGPEQRVSVYRFFTGRSHFWTTNAYEGQNAGFHFDFLAFWTSPRPFPGAVAIYRCFTGVSHFISTDGRCENQIYEGNFGFISNRPTRMMPRELVRCFNGYSHLITLDRNECLRNRYGIEFILGYTY